MPYARFRPLKQWGRRNQNIFREQYIMKRRETLPPFRVPQALQDKGVVFHDPNNHNFPRASTAPPIHISHPAFATPTLPRLHPLYKEKPCLLFDGTEVLSEGLDQALSLTKTVLRKGLPAQLIDVGNVVELPHNHEGILRNYILHSQSTDSALQELPQRHDPVLFWYQYEPVHGIPRERRCELLLDDMFRYCLSFGRDYQQVQHLRYARNQPINATVTYKENQTICLRQKPHLTICTPNLLKPIAKQDEVAATVHEEMADIYPIKPTIDLKTQHVYDNEPFYPRSSAVRIPDSKLPTLFIQTLLTYRVQDQKYPWNLVENLGNLTMHCFGAAAAMAKMKYGNDIEDLKEPIVTQGIQVTGSSFDFVVFQLNTLNLVEKNGVKNMVWVDGGGLTDKRRKGEERSFKCFSRLNN